MNQERKINYQLVQEKITSLEHLKDELTRQFRSLSEPIQALYGNDIRGSRIQSIKNLENQVDNLEIVINTKLNEVIQFFKRELIQQVQSADQEQADDIKVAKENIE